MSIEAPYEKAAEEGAKALSKITDAGSKSGSYLTTLFGPTLEELADWSHEAVQNRRQQWRANNVGSVLSSVYMRRGNQDTPPRPIPARLQGRIIDAISNEDAVIIRSLWVNLLHKASHPSHRYDISKLHIRIAEEIEPIEVLILAFIGNFLRIRPDEVRVLPGSEIATALELSLDDIDMYLHHLTGLGCFRSGDKSVGLLVEDAPEPDTYIDGRLSIFSITPLLTSFIEAAEPQSGET